MLGIDLDNLFGLQHGVPELPRLKLHLDQGDPRRDKVRRPPGGFGKVELRISLPSRHQQRPAEMEVRQRMIGRAPQNGFEIGDRLVDIAVLQRIIGLPGQRVGVIRVFAQNLLRQLYRVGLLVLGGEGVDDLDLERGLVLRKAAHTFFEFANGLILVTRGEVQFAGKLKGGRRVGNLGLQPIERPGHFRPPSRFLIKLGQLGEKLVLAIRQVRRAALENLFGVGEPVRLQVEALQLSVSARETGLRLQ